MSYFSCLPHKESFGSLYPEVSGKHQLGPISELELEFYSSNHSFWFWYIWSTQVLTQFIGDANYVVPFVERYNTDQKACV